MVHKKNHETMRKWVASSKHVNNLIHHFLEIKASENKKLFTLKCFRNIAETLPHSIYSYTYSYLGCGISSLKKCFLLTICFFVFSESILLAGCSTISCAQEEQDRALHLSNLPLNCFKQLPQNKLNPPYFYTCNETLEGNDFI